MGYSCYSESNCTGAVILFKKKKKEGGRKKEKFKAPRECGEDDTVSKFKFKEKHKMAS